MFLAFLEYVYSLSTQFIYVALSTPSTTRGQLGHYTTFGGSYVIIVVNSTQYDAVHQVHIPPCMLGIIPGPMGPYPPG